MESDRKETPLTAAGLDRLAHEWSERRVVMNGVGFQAKADRARADRLAAALPSLLALARKGLEADKAELSELDAEVLHDLVDDFEDAVRDRERADAKLAHERAKARQEATRTALMRVLILAAAAAPDALAERDALRKHYDAAGPEHNLLALLDLYHEREQASLAELERVKARLDRATLFLTADGVKIAAAIDDGYLVDATWFPSLEAAWSAADQAARTDTVKGGE